MPRTWPADWEARRAGQDCPKCAEGRPGQDPWGVRFFAGSAQHLAYEAAHHPAIPPSTSPAILKIISSFLP